MKLVTGNKIYKNPIPKNQYWVHINIMHGDADKYETLDWGCDDKLEAMLHYEVHSLAMTLGGEVTDTDQVEIRKILQKYLDAGCKMLQKEDLAEMASDYFDEVPGDCTCDGQVRASIEDVEITYFDENGDEFEVEVMEEN